MIAKLFFLFAIVSYPLCAQNIEGRDLIRDPVVSNRCKTLLNERKNKIELSQRLHALMRRNEKLLQKVPPQRSSIKAKLEFNQTKIKNSIRLSKLSLQKMEENIVRRGCPGVSL